MVRKDACARESHSRTKAGQPGYDSAKQIEKTLGNQYDTYDDDGDHPVWKEQDNIDDVKAQAKLKEGALPPVMRMQLRDAFHRANAARGSRIRAAVDVLLVDPIGNFRKAISPRPDNPPVRPLHLSSNFARTILVLFALYGLALFVDTVDDQFLEPKTISQRFGFAPPCDCKARPCVYDSGCADLISHPFGGLGCNAEGEQLCRYEIMDCTPEAALMQPCFSSGSCKWFQDGLGCNAAGKKNLRFCGFGDYADIACPRHARPSKIEQKGVSRSAVWQWG